MTTLSHASAASPSPRLRVVRPNTPQRAGHAAHCARDAVSQTCSSLLRPAAPAARIAAGFSDCRRFRYWLTRTWDELRPPLAVIGLTPSTADAVNNDPTVRCCIRYARDWGHGGLVMPNLFASRATDPRDMRAEFDPVGPDNDANLQAHTRGRRVRCAWGAHGEHRNRARHVLELLRGRDLVCLGTTRNGEPKHPLYLRADLEPARYTMATLGDAR